MHFDVFLSSLRYILFPRGQLYSLFNTDLTSKIPKGKKLITIISCAKDVARGEQLVKNFEIVYCDMLGFESLGSLVYASGLMLALRRTTMSLSLRLLNWGGSSILMPICREHTITTPPDLKQIHLS